MRRGGLISVNWCIYSSKGKNGLCEERMSAFAIPQRDKRAGGEEGILHLIEMQVLRDRGEVYAGLPCHTAIQVAVEKK